jgi:cytidine deaminase
MEKQDIELVNAAQAVQGNFQLRRDFCAGYVAAAIRTVDGNIYTGICIDLACGLGFCAEAAAISEMLKNRETNIDTVAAVGPDGILGAPCGRCREMIIQVNKKNIDTRILMPSDKETTLRKLLPEHWLQ